MRAKPSSNYGSDTEPGSANRTFLIGGHVLNAPKPVPGLYLVATPIGHLGDITLRALETLAGVDIIACEDTRITRRLTERYAISAELKPYHEHNAAMARPRILEKLAQGASIALVSDAGTPLISDPGFKLVREVCAAGHAVIAVPGASSVLTALSVAALPTDRFSSRDSCRPGKARGERGWKSSPGSMPRSCCSNPAAACRTRWPIWPKSWAGAMPRSAAN
jgi:16S rRNA (cytidine1402-2'-O)-methyltransferase